MGRAIAALIVLLMGAMPARAWSPDGHRAVCMVAWEQVNPGAKAQVLALLDSSADTEFYEACVWADTILKERPATASWHAMRLPKAAREFDLARDCAGPESCVVAQVEKHTATLKSNAPKAQKAEALKFLAHLIGDLHQPANIAFTDQLPARQISGMFFGSSSNLHDVWDRGLIASLARPGKDAATTIFNAAAWTGRLYGADKKTPLAWANETLWVTVSPPTGYLGNAGGDFFGDRYIRQNRPVALEQIDKAGVRLADVLNEVWR